MKAEIWKGRDGNWFWHIKGRNGEIVCSSEGYTRRSSAKRSLWNFLVGCGDVRVPA